MLLPRAAEAPPTVPDGLGKLGARVTVVPAYKTATATDAAMAFVETNGNQAKKILAKHFPYCSEVCGLCRLPELQRNTEINKPAVAALASRLQLTGVLTSEVNTQGVFPDPQIFSR